MSAAPDLTDLGTRIEAARSRTLDWFRTRAITGNGARLWTESAAADPDQWPGMVLPGTYNSALCLRLIGGLDDEGSAELAATAGWIERSRRPDGSFWLDGMDEANVFKKDDRAESLRYVTWHIANYTLGALQALGRTNPGDPAFVRPFLDHKTLGHWLSRRDMRDPWQEGNNIVNLGSFLLLIGDHGASGEAEAARARLDQLIEWHVFNSEPATGFWGVNQSDGTGRLHAMAGATHNYHLFYALGVPIPHHERAIDYCLTQPPRAVSACIDADLVDILAHAHCHKDHRRGDIADWLATMAEALLAIQNDDGGFPDVPNGDGVRRFDGWRNGFREPQGISCAFGTYFRWIALAMIARCLMPGHRHWQFRPMPGLGYFKAEG